MPEIILPHNTLAQNEAIIQKGLNTFYEVGNALTEIRDNKQYKENYSTFEDYCIDRWDIKKAHAYRLMSSSNVINNLSPIGDVIVSNLVEMGTLVPKTEGQVREIAKAPEEEQAKVWERARIQTGKDQPTALEIRMVVETGTCIEPRKEDGNFHISSGNNDWYTPKSYIESARHVLGSIDCDPASSELAQKTVRAGIYFTEETNGLNQIWDGNIWMNPPYSMPEIKQFIDKLIEEEYDDWIVLTNNSSDTSWFHKLLDASDYACFTIGRINFVNGELEMATRQGQTFFYKGNNKKVFVEEFKAYGAIMEVIHVHAS